MRLFSICIAVVHLLFENTEKVVFFLEKISVFIFKISVFNVYYNYDVRNSNI